MPGRLEAAFAAVDADNQRDPRRIVIDGQTAPAELIYGRRMSTWLDRLEPTASEAVRLAVRAQHVGRFEVPREQYPDGRAGYKAWRRDQAARHADTAAAIARRVGYDDGFAARVHDLVRKLGLKVDAEAQLVEDVACLVFLEHYFAVFATKHDRDKLIDIVRKTWKKMSERGRAAALGLPLGPTERSIVEVALGAPADAGDDV